MTPASTHSLMITGFFVLVGLSAYSVSAASGPYQPPLSKAIFTPDDGSIVFTKAKGSDCFLYKAELATGITRRMTHSGHGCETHPAFSSDGKFLAYMSSVEAGAHAALVVAQADATQPHVLVSGEEDNLKPVFVPNSTRILFLHSGAFEHYSPLVHSRRHKFDIFSVDRVSGQIVALTHKRFYEINGLSVSPDGKQILYAVDDTYPEGEHVVIASLVAPETPINTSQPSVIGYPGLPEMYEPSWFPDGKNILFMAWSCPSDGGDFDYNVYRRTLSSGSVEKLTNLKGMMDSISLSLDGRKAVILRKGEYSILDIASHQLTPVSLKVID